MIRKKIFFCLFSLILIFTLPGCECNHKWETEYCFTSKVCSVCGESSEVAPGHEWKDADWDEPKTCIVCGETEGDSIFSQCLDEILAEKGSLPGQCSSLEEMCVVCFKERIILSEHSLKSPDPVYTLTFGNITDLQHFMERAQTLCFSYGSAYKPGEINNLFIDVVGEFSISCMANGHACSEDIYKPVAFTSLTVSDDSTMKEEIKAAYNYTFGDSLMDMDSYMEWLNTSG